MSDNEYPKRFEILYNDGKTLKIRVNELTIGFNIFDYYARKTIRDALQGRKGQPDNITIYYSYIPNPEDKQQVIINYHFLYAYDPKMEAEDDKKKFSHVFDRESISVVFRLDEAHSLNNSDNQESSESSLDPIPGWYYVQQTKLLEPAMGEKAMVPNKTLANKMEEKFPEGIFTYKLKDLKLGSITSSSWNRLLAFSGYLVDIIIMKGARFPPFTERETDINEYVNGDITVWDSVKISEESEQRMSQLKDNN